MAKILFIDDEAYVMQGLVFSLRDHHTVHIATDGAEAMSELRQHHDDYDLVILDLMLPKGSPIDPNDSIPDMPAENVGEYIFQKHSMLGESIPTVILTATRVSLNGLRTAPRLCLATKPVRIAHLLATIDRLLIDARDRRTTEALNEEPPLSVKLLRTNVVSIRPKDDAI